MRVPFLRLIPIFALLLVGTPAAAAEPTLREEVKDIETAPHWIYDDLPRAQAVAKESGQPLLVVLRCVPCPPGRTLDGQVMQPDRELEALEKKFICVRVIQTKGLDLKLFQYDYDMSWAALFLTPDGAILGRYGTRNASGPGSDGLLSVAGFRAAAERALQLFANYPANKQQLAGKVPTTADYARPELIPGLQERAQGETTRKTCIHCHMVREYTLRAKWEAGQLKPADLWVYPMPQRVGLTLDVEDGLRVKAVSPGSPAAQAGIEPEDELVLLAGQPLISTADVQWVLHTSPVEARLPVTFRRTGKLQSGELQLAGDWKQADISWRASSWYGLRQGIKFEPLPQADRTARGIAPGQLALAIRGMFGRGGPKLQQAGLKTGDVIVALDGQTAELDESQFLARLRLDHGPADSVKLTILRGNNRQDFTIPLW